MQSCDIHVTYNWAVVQRIPHGTVRQARDEPRQQKEFHSCISTHCRRAHALCTDMLLPGTDNELTFIGQQAVYVQ